MNFEDFKKCIRNYLPDETLLTKLNNIFFKISTKIFRNNQNHNNRINNNNGNRNMNNNHSQRNIISNSSQDNNRFNQNSDFRQFETTIIYNEIFKIKADSAG